MKRPGYKEIIEKTTRNTSLSVDERIDEVFDIRQETAPDDEKERLERDVTAFTALIEMVSGENADHAHDLSLMQLFVLLFETYEEQNDYRKMGDAALGVLRLMRDEVTPWADYEQTVPRIVDALRHSAYHHYLYEILLRFLKTAFREGVEMLSVKRQAEEMLKLRMLLDETDWVDHLFDKPMQRAVAGVFSSDELLRFILHPDTHHLRRDPVEYTWMWEDICYDVEDELERRFANAPRHMGFCFHYWNAKRELLKEKYGIEWRSPSQMNPRVMFD